MPTRIPNAASIRVGRSTKAGLGVVIAGLLAAMYGLSSEFDGLDDVFGEEQLEGPRGENTYLSFKSGEFREIDPSPHKPGEQPGEAQRTRGSKRDYQFCAGGLMADHAESSQGSETKRLGRGSAQSGGDILRDGYSFAKGKLCRGRIGLSCLAIHDGGAIAQRPDHGLIHY